MELDELKFRVIYGFNNDQSICIGADELEKAYGLFLYGGRAIFKSGDAIDGKYIQAIRPDFNEMLGWGPDHKLDSYDYQDLDHYGFDRNAKLALAKAKERVEYLIANGQQELIGKNVDIPEPDVPIQRRGGAMQPIKNLLPKYEEKSKENN